MGRIPMYRDIWCFGPPSNGYPGAFPNGFINKVKRKWWGRERLLLFSGSHKDTEGLTVDIKPETNPDIIADCRNLPLRDESFDFILADPPYSERFARELYDLDYCGLVYPINEMARLVRPGGHVVLLHYIVPQRHPNFTDEVKKLKIVGQVGVFVTAGFSRMRALTVWRKREYLNVG